jgi:hypothetical protein
LWLGAAAWPLQIRGEVSIRIEAKLPPVLLPQQLHPLTPDLDAIRKVWQVAVTLVNQREILSQVVTKGAYLAIIPSLESL